MLHDRRVEDAHVMHIGRVDFRNVKRLFGIKHEDRFSHVYVIGKTALESHRHAAASLRSPTSFPSSSATDAIGQDRIRDRKRREELHGRKLSPAGLTEPEKAEYTKLEGLFREEDRDRGRKFELAMKQFNAEVGGGDPLTDEEVQEAAELELRFPPDPDFAKGFEWYSEALRKFGEED